MLRTQLKLLIEAARDRLVASGKLPEAVSAVKVEISDTKTAEHGDYACNFAMVATKAAGIPPRQIGELLKAELEADESLSAVELAGPGFLNLRLVPQAIARFVPEVLAADASFVRVDVGKGEPVNVEFVSVNPNGPITIGSGRGAAIGDTLARVLDAAGYQVNREYYVNDGVNSEQMRVFAESVRTYCRQILSLGTYDDDGRWRHSIALDVNNGFLKSLGDGMQRKLAKTFEQMFEEYVEQRGEGEGDPEVRAFIGSQLWRLNADWSPYQSYGHVLRERYRHAYANGSFFPPDLLPERSYKGEYVIQVGRALIRKYGRLQIHEHDLANDVAWFQSVSQNLMIERQRSDLKSFRVCFDKWFSEQSLHNSGAVKSALEKLVREGDAYWAVKPEESEDDDYEGAPAPVVSDKEALWLRSTAFGDDKDRVLVRSDGRPAYIAGDVAYMQDKFDRGFSKCKLILGPDHHGYIGRMYAVARSLGHTAGPHCEFEMIIYQIVRFVKDGKPAPMRKRDGNIYELRDLIDEIGKTALPDGPKEEQSRIGADVGRFFFLMRSHDTHMDFDIDLATKQSNDNPVFYAQYAHARISSVIAKAVDAGVTVDPDLATKKLEHPREMALIKKILDLPFEVERCARDFGVHRLATYAVELARTFHHFYDDDACMVIQSDQPELSSARLALCQATRLALAATFDLLGVSAPERMERTERA